MSPDDIKVLILRNYEHAALQGQKDLEHMIKNLKKEDVILNYLLWAKCNHKGSYEREAR